MNIVRITNTGRGMVRVEMHDGVTHFLSPKQTVDGVEDKFKSIFPVGDTHKEVIGEAYLPEPGPEEIIKVKRKKA